MSDREQIKAYYDTSPETEWARGIPLPPGPAHSL